MNKCLVQGPGLVLWLMLAACSATAPPEAPSIPAVGEVQLQRAQLMPAEHELLNIGIVTFRVPAADPLRSAPGESIYAEIAEKETHYLPYVLRNVLVESNHWGAVRVLPEDDPSVDLTIEGTLLESSGLSMQLHILARDSSGREWLNRRYRDVTVSADYPGPDPFLRGFSAEAPPDAAGDDPFADIHEQIANDLLLAKQQLLPGQLREIQLLSDLRYAADLAPAVFQHYLQSGPEGLLRLRALPADDDPMLRRVRDIKLRHHVFIDTIDEYYEALHEEMQTPYALWRRYSRDQALEDRAARRQAETGTASGSSSFTGLSQSYNRYMWAKLFAQEFTALAAGFNNEVAPAILELNEQVHGLTGPVEEQYRQWWDILRQIFEIETGQAAGDDKHDE